MKKFLCMAAISVLSVSAAKAEIVKSVLTGPGLVTGTCSTLDLSSGSPNGGFENTADLIAGIDEMQNVTVAANTVIADYLVDPASSLETFTGFSAGVDLPAGCYNSHLLHFDPFGDNADWVSVENATFTFDTPIVALIAKKKRLMNSDDIFGCGIPYGNKSARGLETHNGGADGDTFTVAGSTLTVDYFQVINHNMDELRVLTSCDDPPPCDCCGPTNVDIMADSVILVRDIGEDRAQFKLENVTGIGEAARAAVDDNEPLTFKVGACDPDSISEPIFELNIPASDLDVAGNRMIYPRHDGLSPVNYDIVRCVFSSERCDINIRGDFIDSAAQALDNLLTGDMTVCLKVGDTTYTNAGPWTQYDSGNGGWTASNGWTKYRP